MMTHDRLVAMLADDAQVQRWIEQSAAISQNGTKHENKPTGAGSPILSETGNDFSGSAR